MNENGTMKEKFIKVDADKTAIDAAIEKARNDLAARLGVTPDMIDVYSMMVGGCAFVPKKPKQEQAKEPAKEPEPAKTPVAHATAQEAAMSSLKAIRNDRCYVKGYSDGR